MINPRIKENKFENYEEVAQGFLDLMAPLDAFYREGRSGHLNLGTHGTVYSKETREAEAFLRPLWGLAPYLTQQESPYLTQYLKGIIAGTDPSSPDYWGTIQDYDQLIVEMASLSTLLLLNKEKTWDALTKKEQHQLHQWLIQVNQRDIPGNNWHFFRILVNVAMKACDMPYSQDQIEADFALIDSFYIGKGWYFDGVQTQIDYYVSFAIHYYSLLYYRFVPDDTKRNEQIKERATLFAQTFKYWFSANGEALPFGRSLTYRFAQVSFFSALVFADIEALPWGEIKGIISRHLHRWMNQPIFTAEGLLSVGYHYQNLNFAEGYNGPGSPYWSFKSFVLLAVPRNHDYWKAAALPLQLEKTDLPLPESKAYYQHNEDRTHALTFPAGQFIGFQSHPSAKYSKFVYSSHFGFSTPKSNYWYYEGAFDNCLALAEDDHYFRTKGLDTEYEILADRILHWWRPWEDVAIKTTIVPLAGCHVRIHEIETERPLFVYEGGFSIPIRDGRVPTAVGMKAEVKNQSGCSKIENICGFETAGVVRPEPNTNLMAPLTALPHLKTALKPGKHLLVSLVTGLLPAEKEQPVTIKVQNQIVLIDQAQQLMVELQQ